MKIILCSVSLLLMLYRCGSEDLFGEQLYFPRTIHEYENFGSVTIFRHSTPDAASRAIWTFKKSCSDFGKCQDVDYEIVLNLGSLPIINPYNTSLPGDAYFHDEHKYEFTLGKDKHSVQIIMPNPEPGEWYVVVYRLKPAKEKIEQKGLSTDCAYFLQSMLFYTTVNDIQALSGISKNTYRLSETEEYVYFRYQTKEGTSKLTFTFSGCVIPTVSVPLDHCELNVTLSAQTLPTENSKPATTCSATSACVLNVDNPVQDAWYYLRVAKVHNKEQYEITFHIFIETEECDEVQFMDSFHFLSNINSQHQILYDGRGREIISETNNSATTSIPLELFTDAPTENNSRSCIPVIPLTTIIEPGALAKSYLALGFNETDVYQVEHGRPLLLWFNIDPYEDVGGVFTIEVFNVKDKSLKNPEVTLCLRMHNPPIMNLSLSCDPNQQHSGNITDKSLVRWRLPFPQAGRWYLGVLVECYDDNWAAIDCGEDAEIEMTLRLSECIDGCGRNGKCQLHYQDGLQYFSCKCLYGYRGFSCSDDSEAWPRRYYLARVLLLTLSNIIFLVATALAVYRFFFAESVSYFATAFFSTAYHACDSTPRCLIDYDTLQFCDFFSSFMSILLTLIAMSKLKPPLKSFLHILGAFTLAFSAQYDRFSLWAIGVPLAGGVVVLLVSWGLRMYKTKMLYPSKRRWIFFSSLAFYFRYAVFY